MLHNSQKDFLKRHIGPSNEDIIDIHQSKIDSRLYIIGGVLKNLFENCVTLASALLCKFIILFFIH